MPKYLFTGSFTASGAAGVRAEGGTSRAKALREAFASVGGTMESYYFGFGGDDYYVIGELPDNATAAAVSLNTSATGAARTRTVVLLTPEEVDRASGIKGTYRAPGA